jgi:hypothetical protein
MYIRFHAILLVIRHRYQGKLKFFNIFAKNTTIKFYENPPSENPVVSCGRTNMETDRQT